MKVNGAFVAIIIALMAVMILFQLNAPAHFKWDDMSQSCNSKQPLGCYVMDSVLRASVPQGYEVCGYDIDKYLGQKSRRGGHTFLFLNNHTDFIEAHDVDLLKLIQEGNNVVIAADYVGYNDYQRDIGEILGFSYQAIDNLYMDYFSKATLSDRSLYDTISWHSDGLFNRSTYLTSSAFCSKGLDLSVSFRVLATLNKAQKLHTGYYGYYYRHESVVAGVRDYGKGKVVVMSMPLLFTNYGILNDTIRPLVLRLLSECGNKPVVRYDPSHYSQATRSNQASESPLRYLLANRPLRWAFYLALATLVAFVVFSARRRQRVIPVIKPPVNHMMDFVKRIGGIYYKRHDNVDLLSKRYATFSNDLRVKAMIDIDNYDYLDDELQALSHRTGIPIDQIKQHIHDVQEATGTTWISDRRLQQLIDVMNDIMHRINI